MSDLAKQVYEACEVGAVGWIKPDRPAGFDLDKFPELCSSRTKHQINGLG